MDILDIKKACILGSFPNLYAVNYLFQKANTILSYFGRH
jgi:hypothetical protein